MINDCPLNHYASYSYIHLHLYILYILHIQSFLIFNHLSSFSYFSKKVFLYILLNWIMLVLCFNSCSKPFHKITPQIVILILLRVVLTLSCLKCRFPLKLYPPSLSMNSVFNCIGSRLFLALYMICAVLNWTRSVNFNMCDFKNNTLVCSRYPTLLITLIALFCNVHNGCRLVFYVFPQISTHKSDMAILVCSIEYTVSDSPECIWLFPILR